MSMDASAVECLGNPVEIAETAVREFRRRKNLLSRSWLAALGTFVLVPLPVLVVAWLAAMLALETAGELLISVLLRNGVIPAAQAGDDAAEFFREQFRHAPLPVSLLLQLVLIAVLAIPAAGVAILYARLAARTPRRWLWGMTACALLGLGFGATRYDVTLSESPGQSQIMFMAGLVRQPLQQCLVSIFPLAIGVLVLRRATGTTKETPPVHAA